MPVTRASPAVAAARASACARACASAAAWASRFVWIGGGAHQGLDDQERRPPGDQRRAAAPDQPAQGRVGHVEALAAADPEGDQEAEDQGPTPRARVIQVSIGDGGVAARRALPLPLAPAAIRRARTHAGAARAGARRGTAPGGPGCDAGARRRRSRSARGGRRRRARSQRTTTPLTARVAHRSAAVDGDVQARAGLEAARPARSSAPPPERFSVTAPMSSAGRRRAEGGGVGDQVDRHAHGAAALHAARARPTTRAV